jgi:hypothetical protein
MSVQLLPLDSPTSLLDRAAASLAPGILRVGGSEGDVVVYDVPSHNSTCLDMNAGRRSPRSPNATGCGWCSGWTLSPAARATRRARRWTWPTSARC